MKALLVRAWILIATTAFAIGCGSGDAPVVPTVKQEIAPDRTLKKIDPFDPKKKKGGLSAN